MMFIIEFVSTFFLILSMLLLSAVLLKHFKGMKAPAHWVYYLGAFALLAISNAYTKLFGGAVFGSASLETIDTALRLVANLSILLGSYEIFRRYESSVAAKVASAAAKKKRRRK